ncbi:hypothetical protein [Enterobacter kobei]|uniref:hypothetical protein n=1 Tax=Enterobacter kobei TaxID=208224 RepID=UPI001910BC9C|nr:hypothetical protein [Enterobacter kobei]
MLEQEEVEAAFSEGQAVQVAGHKTVCYFVRYLPVVEWSKKSKPRCVVTFGKGGGEMNVFVEDISPIQGISTETLQGEALEVVVVSFNHIQMFELFKCVDGSYSWKTNIQLPEHIKEDLPAFYFNQKALDEMLSFVEKELSC